MPELPEVETIRKYLAESLVGKKITKVKILSKKQFPNNPESVIGEKIIDVQRRAKVLILRLANNNNLLIHLKLSGQLIWVNNASEKNEIKLKKQIPTIGESLPTKSTRVILNIGKGKLFFNELRKFGWIKVLANKDLEKELSKYGTEPFDREFSEDFLKAIFSKTNRAIKLVLLDQEKIAGIGNIYVNEALYLSGIHPQIPANKLTQKQIKVLRENVIKVLKLGLKYGGTSDEYYVKPDATLGRYQDHFLVYRQDDKRCRNCGSKIKRIEIGGRGTFFCPKCQKADEIKK
jgi:formamidopyrimidine-DNA glycosylase